MGVDYYQCNGCSETYADCSDYFTCTTCGSGFCWEECGDREYLDVTEDDPVYTEAENNYGTRPTSCKLCRNEAVTDYALLQFLLKKTNLSRDEAFEEYKVDQSPNDLDKSVTIDYTNYRGERGERKIIPLRLVFEENEFHKPAQWLIVATDVEKNAERSFSLNTLHDWKGSSSFIDSNKTEEEEDNAKD